MKKSTEVANVLSEESSETLKQLYPVEQSFSRILLPRITFLSQDKVEGKGKAMKVIAEAGTFISEKPNEAGEWEKKELGKEIDVQIFYHRRQLRYWDAANESFINSPIYDDENDIVPLFQDKKQIDKGTQRELQAKYPPKEGRKMSSLEDERILYVMYEGDMYQMNVKGGSKWAFLTYARSINPSAVLTTITIEDKKNGSISWNQMVFTQNRDITEDEAKDIIAKVTDIRTAINSEKAFYQNVLTGEQKKTDEELEKF